MLKVSSENNDDLKLRILYLEQELDDMRKYINKLESKLEDNPFTRDTFRDNYGNNRKYSE